MTVVSNGDQNVKLAGSKIHDFSPFLADFQRLGTVLRNTTLTFGRKQWDSEKLLFDCYLFGFV
jgi:hypothetical protein